MGCGCHVMCEVGLSCEVGCVAEVGCGCHVTWMRLSREMGCGEMLSNVTCNIALQVNGAAGGYQINGIQTPLVWIPSAAPCVDVSRTLTDPDGISVESMPCGVGKSDGRSNFNHLERVGGEGGWRSGGVDGEEGGGGGWEGWEGRRSGGLEA